MTAAGLEHLSGLSRLETLNLAGTPVGDEAVPLLGRLPALRSLYAWNTLLTEPALAGLTRARDQSRRVQQLRREVAEAEAKLRAETFTLHRGAEPPAPTVPPPNPP